MCAEGDLVILARVVRTISLSDPVAVVKGGHTCLAAVVHTVL